MIVDIVSRATWGARYANGVRPAPVPAVGCYLHHAVSDPKANDIATTRALEDTGQARFGYGISYSFVVHGSGAVHEGHSVGREGTHTLQTKPVRKNLNPTHRAIVYPGNFENRRPTAAQIEATAWLIAHGWLAGWWTTPALVGGHRDVTATACPGTHAYAQIPAINARAAQIIAEVGDPPSQEDDVMMLVQDAFTGWWAVSGVWRYQVPQEIVDKWRYIGKTEIVDRSQPDFADLLLNSSEDTAKAYGGGTADPKVIAEVTADVLHRRLAS